MELTFLTKRLVYLLIFTWGDPFRNAPCGTRAVEFRSGCASLQTFKCLSLCLAKSQCFVHTYQHYLQSDCADAQLDLSLGWCAYLKVYFYFEWLYSVNLKRFIDWIGVCKIMFWKCHVINRIWTSTEKTNCVKCISDVRAAGARVNCDLAQWQFDKSLIMKG